MLRQRVQTNLNGIAPVELMAGTSSEADELDQNAGGSKHAPSRPRRRANKRAGYGTLADDRSPILSVIARETGAPRFWGCDHANTCAGAGLITENGPADSSALDTDEGPTDRDRHPAHAIVRHSPHAWVRDDEGDNQRQAHGHT
jgi:hypothetical protein